MPNVYTITGNASDTGATVVAKVDGSGPVRILVADNQDMVGPAVYGPQSVSNDVAKINLTGLEPSTRYWYQVQDGETVDTSRIATFLTHPPVGSPAGFTFAAATCSGQSTPWPGVDALAPGRMSNSPVHSHLAQRARSEGWLFFWHGGDRGYYDLGSGSHGITGGASLANYRRQFDDNAIQPTQRELHEAVTVEHTPDDHCRGPNDHNRLFNGANWETIYRERYPHSPLVVSNGHYGAKDIARALVMYADVRSRRDPNSDPDVPGKTKLGADQIAWMESVLMASQQRLLVWLMPGRWRWGTEPGADSFGAFTHERNQLVQLFGDTGWLGRMCIVSGDAHNFGLHSGANPSRPIPNFQFAPLDANPSSGVPSEFDVATAGGMRGVYGTIRVRDIGRRLVVTASGWQA